MQVTPYPTCERLRLRLCVHLFIQRIARSLELAPAVFILVLASSLVHPYPLNHLGCLQGEL